MKLAGVLLAGVYEALVQKLSSYFLMRPSMVSFSVPFKKLLYKFCMYLKYVGTDAQRIGGQAQAPTTDRSMHALKKLGAYSQRILEAACELCPKAIQVSGT